ncbi:hypothetical protein D0B54_17895 [Solimonas sp. K1W22B-7]|uniref:hypothetical protein n=1 Tax=Solimonas sp. K1W22B-7 TaxID=2303331 RepID=UPI000E32F98E|nr:hypothetical protein [Solimonas sp. K1W22B-7]AXQ30433.1 hypothetical protein D0B54_17895 [Solimonas sp. K1W22B-7]
MKRLSLFRRALFLGGALAALWTAWSIYFEIGFDGFGADFALIKYVLGVDRSGGALQEHITSYIDDRVPSILSSLVLLVFAAYLLSKTTAGPAVSQRNSE